MRLSNKIAAFACLSITMIFCMTVSVCAAPSISNLHEKQEVTVSLESTDGTNTAEVLSQVGIYTNEAISDQYKIKDENGNLIPTHMSDMIDAAADTLTKTDENGKSIVDSIPTVTEILSNISKKSIDEYEKEYGYNPDDLDQLTYMQDFKYITTDYRVIAGEKVTVKNSTKVLDNGMIRVSIKGSEILRSASIDQYVIIQVDPVTEKIYFFKMKEYDEKNGDYTADFPCVGPYMITQIMER